MSNECESFIILRSPLQSDEHLMEFDPSSIKKREEWPMSVQPKIVTVIDELMDDELELGKLADEAA